MAQSERRPSDVTPIPDPEPSVPPSSVRFSTESFAPRPSTESIIPKPKGHPSLGLSVLALIAVIGAAYIAHPLWMGLAVGTVMAFTSDPLYKWLGRVLGQRRALAALLTTITGGIASLAVIGTVTYIAVSEIVDLVVRFRVPSAHEILGVRGMRLLERAHVSPDALIEQLNTALVSFSERAAGGVASVLSTTTSLMLTVVIAFFTMYYVLLEWPALVRRLQRLMPLDPRHTRALANEFRNVGRSAFVGTMGTALVQGGFAAIGFALAGVSQPLLWGTITMLASFLPVIGTAAVWVPVSIVAFATGRSGAAIFIFFWGLLVTTAVADYVVRPRLVGSHTQVHPLPLLISLLGGVEMFGLMGVLVGPIFMALCLAVLRIYEVERMRDGDSATSTPPPVPE